MDRPPLTPDTVSRELLQRLFELFRRVRQHWAAVNSQLPPDRPLTLLAGTERERFAELEEALAAAEDALDGAILDRELAADALRQQKDALHPRILWWRQNLTASLPRSPWLAGLPPLPQRGASAWSYRTPLAIMSFVWARLAALTPPPPGLMLKAPDGFTREDFEAASTALEAATDAHVDAGVEEALARAERALLREEAAELLKAYGHAVRSRLPASAPLRRALPPLWPRRVKAPAAGPASALSPSVSSPGEAPSVGQEE